MSLDDNCDNFLIYIVQIFDISDYNLHGENIFSFSDSQKRKVIGINKNCVGSCYSNSSEQGFQYKLNNREKIYMILLLLTIPVSILVLPKKYGILSMKNQK